MAAAASANRTMDGRAELARQVRQVIAAGGAAETGTGVPTSAGAPVRPPGAGAGAAGVPGGAGAVGVPGRPSTPEQPGTPSDPGGRPAPGDWSGDPVPSGSLGRPRRPGAAGEPATGTAGGPTVPAPAEQREPAGPHGAPQRAEEKDARTPAPDARRSEAPLRADGAETADSTGTGHGPVRPGGPVRVGDLERLDGPARADVPAKDDGSDAAGGPAQGGDAVRSGASVRSGGTGATDEPGPNGEPSRTPHPGAREGGVEHERPEPSGPADAQGNAHDGRHARDAQADLPEATGPRAAGRDTARPDAAGSDAFGPAGEENPASADGSEPPATRGPAELPASDPRPSETEAPERSDDVPAPKSVRAESGTPADPAAEPGAARRVRDEAGAGEAAQTSDASQDPGTPGTSHALDTPDAGTGAHTETDADDPHAPQAPLPPVPLDPGHRSSEVERTAFRALAEGMWDRHGAAVARSLARMPALRGREQEAARADLIALRMYLHTSEGPLSHGAVTRALRDYDPGMLPYGACVASALTRLPSYRGAVLRGTGSDPTAGGSGVPALPRRGTLLRDAALLSTTPLDPTRTAMMPGGSYVIWSVTGRRVRQLSDHSRGPEEVVFAPGTLFRVLDVRRAGPSVQIFLRELTGPATAATPDPEADRAVLARLDDVVRGRSAAPEGTGHWPERCVGAVGAGP